MQYNIIDFNKIETTEEARSLAIDWQHWQSERAFSYEEMAAMQSNFDNLTERFPELKEEFKENSII